MSISDSGSARPAATASAPPRTSTFTCLRCGLTVTRSGPDGEPRHHCPSCLYSEHVIDHAEGGPSDCRSRMSPIAISRTARRRLAGHPPLRPLRRADLQPRLAG